MKYVVFNNDSISKLSLGTVQFGLDYGIANTHGKPTQIMVNEIVDYVYSQNLNCFDTAQAYGNSEKVLGSSIKGKDVFVISKQKSDIFEENTQEGLKKSLDKLGLQSLYGLLLHDSRLLYSWSKIHSLLVENLIKQAKIKYFGVSIYTSADFDLAVENDNIQLIQLPFNIFDQRAIKEKWFKRAKEKNKLIFIRSVFLQGLLTMDLDKIPVKLESSKMYLKIFESLCKEFNMSKSELALNFVDSIASNSIILFGCDNIEQAKKNINTYNSMNKLTRNKVKRIIYEFNCIEEEIYNPTKWQA